MLNNYFKYLVALGLICQIPYQSLAQVPSNSEVDFSRWYLRSQGIPLHGKAGLTLGVYEVQTLNARVLETSLLLKTQLTKQISLLSGLTFDFYQDVDGFSSDIDAQASFGIQYDINENAYLQGIFNYELKSYQNPYSIKTGSPASFSLRSGFKF